MFTTPCFIRKNTPELREKLEKLGYIRELYQETDKYLYAGNHGYVSANIIDNYYKDCADNESMFLALAALRDDSDSHQYFIFTKDVQIGVASHKEGDLFYSDSIKKVPLFHLRKATADEIIEHFTMKGGAE
jgi:hypothetical protein